MIDELQQAYSAYQSALYNLRDPKVKSLVINHDAEPGSEAKLSIE